MRRLLIAALTAASLLAPQAQAQDQTESRVLGGDQVPPTRWPMAAALLYNGVQGCSGTVVAADWVLTAAHCVQQNGAALPSSLLSVQIGTEILEGRGQVVPVAQVVVHGDFEPGANNQRDFPSYQNDIALLRLATPVTVTPAAVLGLQAAGRLSPVGGPALAIGWKPLTGPSTAAGTTLLAQTDLTLAQGATCGSRIAPRPFSAEMVCAQPKAPAPEDSVNTACAGNAGGPLFVPNRRGGFTLAGIVSAQATDCALDSPVIATSIPAHLDWIAARVSGLIVEDSPIESGFWSLDGAPGAGLAIEVQGARLILGAMLYDDDGRPTWYFAHGAFAGQGSFTAMLDQFADGSDTLYTAGIRTWRRIGSPGNVTVTFQGAATGTLNIGDRRWPIRRSTLADGRPAPNPGLPETGWYSTTRDPGRFWFIEGQGDRLVVADFAYGTVAVEDHFPARWTLSPGIAAKVGTTTVMSAPIYGCAGGQSLTAEPKPATCADTDFLLSATFPGAFTGWLIPGGRRAVAIGRHIDR